MSVAQTTQKHNFLEPVTVPFRLPTLVYGAMLAIWHLRPAMQRRFPIHKQKPEDWLKMLAWCAGDGKRLYAILRSIPEWESELTQRIELPKVKDDKWENGFSVDMFLYGLAHHHYALGPMLYNGKARNFIASDYWCGARQKRHINSPAPWQCEYLAKRHINLNSFIDAIRDARKTAQNDYSQLDAEFGLSDIRHVFEPSIFTGAVVASFPTTNENVAYLPENLQATNLRLPLRILQAGFWMSKRNNDPPSESQLAEITSLISANRHSTSNISYPFGVNLFGYAKGELGIGEDIRMVAQALKSQNIPFCIVNVLLGKGISQEDASAETWVVKAPQYAINLFCMTGIEQVRYACVNGLDVFQGRYNIGLWPWELPKWPSSCNHAFSMVDEIWGISRFTAKAFENSNLPVYTMTLPVTVNQVSEETRIDFGLPENDYLFVFSFDLNSKIARKNPAGLISAFQSAFPRHKHEAVGLVVKVSHTTSKNQEWKRIEAMIKRDKRIHLLDVSMRRPQLMALYRCCDCFVSLHRAEGFGRALAESLLLGKQLIATSYSGNMDYCKSERVSLVRYTQRSLKPFEYFHGEGQVWAEPNIDHAAELMRENYSNPKRIIRNEFDFSPNTVGAQYSLRLQEIKQQFSLTRDVR